jgi:hypothetical protein
MRFVLFRYREPSSLCPEIDVDAVIYSRGFPERDMHLLLVDLLYHAACYSFLTPASVCDPAITQQLQSKLLSRVWKILESCYLFFFSVTTHPNPA